MSDTGRVRRKNEDSFLIQAVRMCRGETGLLYVLADGMGGREHGDIASQKVIRTFHDLTERLQSEQTGPEAWMIETAIAAHEAVIRKGESLGSEGIGSTLVAALFTGETAYLTSVGDSRAYLLRDEALVQITRDDSLVALMVAAGQLKADEIYTHPRRNEVTRYLGKPGPLEPGRYAIKIQAGDAFLFCSDGLWEMVRDDEIARMLIQYPDPAEAVQRFIETANASGGTDNITAAVVRSKA